MWTSVRQTICALVLVLGSASAFASEIDYEHGKAQVKQLLIDRPLFRFYRDSKNKIKELKATDAPYIWAVRQFGGGATGEPVVWMPQEPEGVRSDYVGRWKFAPGFIRIASGRKDDDGVVRPLTFDQGWQCIVFELNNIVNSKAMNKLFFAARTGRISRDEFIWEGPKYEFEALNKMIAFYKDVWKPWAHKGDVSTDPDVWAIEGRAQSYEEWAKRLAERTDCNGYPWKHYGEIYDSEVVQK